MYYTIKTKPNLINGKFLELKEFCAKISLYIFPTFINGIFLIMITNIIVYKGAFKTNVSVSIISIFNGYKTYVDILTGEKLSSI